MKTNNRSVKYGLILNLCAIVALSVGATGCKKKPVAVPEAGFVNLTMVSRPTAEAADWEYADASGAVRVRYVQEGATGDDAVAQEQTFSFKGAIRLPILVRVKTMRFELARLEADDAAGTQVLRLAGRRLQGLLEASRSGSHVRLVVTLDGSAEPEWELVEPATPH